MNTAQSLLVFMGFDTLSLDQHTVNTIRRYTKKTKRQHPNKAVRGVQRKMEAAYKKWKAAQQ